MDINTIIDIVKDIPPDKWGDDETIKEVIKTAANKSGRIYTEDELNSFVHQFKQFAQESSPLTLIPMLLKKGISKNQLDEIKRKMNSN